MVDDVAADVFLAEVDRDREEAGFLADGLDVDFLDFTEDLEIVAEVFFGVGREIFLTTTFFLLFGAVDFLVVALVPGFFATVFLLFNVLVDEAFFAFLGDEALRDTVFEGLDDRRAFFEELFPGMDKTFLLPSRGDGYE